MTTLSNVKLEEARPTPLSVGLTPDTYPEATSSKTGESVRYDHAPDKKWFVFRATRGREDKASDLLVEDGTYTYIAKKLVDKYVRGKRRTFLRSLIPNLVFAYTTKEKAEEYASDKTRLGFLNYYYDHFRQDEECKNPPLTILEKEMETFIQATSSHNKHLLFVRPSQVHYRHGDTVIITEGLFRGVEGRVARIAGQQRVVVTLSKIGLVSTAYIPTAFLHPINQK